MLEAKITPHRKLRLNKAPDPRFKADISDAPDPIRGCPGEALPAAHPARKIKEPIATLDFSKAEAKYSSQGRYGFHPRHVFGALVYGSILGIHFSTRLAESLRWDLVARFVAGGHAISEGRLRTFKRENLALYQDLQGQLLALAADRGLLETSELAVDSVRFRAHASKKATRTQKRSRSRLKELSAVDTSTLTVEEVEAHCAKVTKHTETIKLCEEHHRTSVISTSPDAGLMKFPDGGSAPGHRATIVAAGVRQRFIVDVLVDSAANDIGKLGPAILRARDALQAADVRLDKPIQVAGDAGYFCAEDLAFAATNKAWVDVLIAERSSRHRGAASKTKKFDVDSFMRNEAGQLVCPAQRVMQGPTRDGTAARWEGDGCDSCGLKEQCTTGKRRSVTLDLAFHAVRDAMRDRLNKPAAKERYNQRIATVEPVFSDIQCAMGYRRVTSGKKQSVQAEVLLKVVAYNIKRVLRMSAMRSVAMQVDMEPMSQAENAVS